MTSRGAKAVQVDRVLDRDDGRHRRPTANCNCSTASRLRLYSAVTLVVMPPRAVKSPTTVMRLGAQAADQVVENLVGDRLVENPLVPELEQIVFEGLELDARASGT